MKTKNIGVVALLNLGLLLACQQTNKNTNEINSATVDDAVASNMVTDTTAINRGADMSIFLNEAAIWGMQEIEMGKLAMEKSANPKITNFASRLVKDHVKIAQKLKVLAQEKKMTLPSELTQTDLSHIAEMKNMSANEFDKHFIDMMVTQHIKLLDLFKSGTTSGDIPLQNFAINSLRTLEKHYKMATNLKNKLK